MKRATQRFVRARFSGEKSGGSLPGMVWTTIAAPMSIGPYGVRVQLDTTPNATIIMRSLSHWPPVLAPLSPSPVAFRFIPKARSSAPSR